MICSGKDVFTGEGIEVGFGDSIHEISPARETPGWYLAPGWVDIQVNGFAGVDYNVPATSHEEIARSITYLHTNGVTRFYPTVITGGPDDMREALANLASAKDSLAEGATMDGFHVEGPHISPDEGPRGAHPRQWVRKPDVEEFHRMQEAARGYIRLVTVAPEWPEAPHFIEALTREGIVISIGHTAASGDQIRDAVSAGASMSTHLGNGAHSVMRRHPNYIWEQLAEDRLTASFIVDGIHLPGCFLIAALRAKSLDRSVMTTDASAPAGCPPGRYSLGEQAVDLTEDNRVVLAGQDRLAGSALRMDRGVENLIKIAGLSLGDAVRLATVNPARAGNVPGRTEGLKVGQRADFVLFDFDADSKAVRVRETWIGGRQVYRAAA